MGLSIGRHDVLRGRWKTSLRTVTRHVVPISQKDRCARWITRVERVGSNESAAAVLVVDTVAVCERFAAFMQTKL